jgi:wyosine [tRNA(Phe)-imidazoG37] synthetase (radical SAM superfamily)
MEREPFVDPDLVARQTEQALARGPRPEVITLAGSGEPTLHAGLEQVFQALRRVTDLPLCLLTNGGLLWQEPVARAALQFDLVLPSLDAADAETFQRINRPAAGIDFTRMLDGLRSFTHAFRGRCQLEVLLVRGLNDSRDSLEALGRELEQLDVASVDLNTVVRPPADRGVQGLEQAQLEQVQARLTGCQARIVASFRSKSRNTHADDGQARQRILETVARRPCTVEDLAAALELSPETVRAECDAALRDGELREEQAGAGKTYYRRP